MHKKSYGKAHKKKTLHHLSETCGGTLHFQSLLIQLLQTIMKSKLGEKCSFLRGKVKFITKGNSNQYSVIKRATFPKFYN